MRSEVIEILLRSFPISSSSLPSFLCFPFLVKKKFITVLRIVIG